MQPTKTHRLSPLLLPSALLLGTIVPAQAQTPPPPPPLPSTAPAVQGAGRTIIVDYKAIKGPHSTVFRTCVGAGRVGEGLRADWQAQLKLCKDEIGFEYLRCHGLLHDELGVYREDKDGKPIYNWQYIDMVYDYLLSIGVRPFVEIGFMPNDLATIRTENAGTDGMADDPAHPGKKRRVTVFQWRSNVTPPKDWAKWDGLVSALVQHWTARYGADEVAKWPFEIWNEPNHLAFWSPNDDSQRMQEYFELYAHTARAVTSVNAKYRVGGPAGAGPAYIKELIEYATKNDVPLDFITYHCYGLGSGPDSSLYLSPNPHAVANSANSRTATIASSAKPNLPVHITEWSASYSPHDPVHDDYFEAPYILEQLKNTESLGSMSYWTFTDIFEETGIPSRPFHGGFGLLNVQGIKKPAYFAYQFLNRLGNQELANSDAQSWVCRDQKGGVQALLWDLTLKPDATVSDQSYFRQIRPSTFKMTAHLTLKSLPSGSYHLAVYRVGFEKNDAYTEYLKLGAPAQIDRAQTAWLKAIASGKPELERDIRIGKNGLWNADFPLRANDVFLATLTPTRPLKAPNEQFHTVVIETRTCRLSGVELHIAEAGPSNGPLVILLHGFPDFWWGWRHQIEHLAVRGFHVVAPDQRGYNLSRKPKGVAAYNLNALAADVIHLADSFNASTFRLAGHDWGGVVAWQVAARYPARVERLAILNAPHPDVFPRYVRLHPTQALKSTYAAFFQLHWLPERVLKAHHYARLRHALTRSSHSGAFTDSDLERYVAAWAQPGALTAMLNYYRAIGRRPLTRPARIRLPTLVIWGQHDLFLETQIASASLKLCDHGQIQFLDAGHWVQLEAVDAVNEALVRFLK